MNIELLQKTLEVRDNPGLDTIDPRFSDIASLVMEGNYEEAAAQSDAILKEQIYDIRIIGYFLYGHFIEQGVGAMANIYLCLANLLSDNLEAIGPVKNREKHIQTILNWMMKQLIKKLQYEEGKNSNLYEGWISEVSSDQVQEALDAGDELRRMLGPVLEDAAGPVLDGMVKVNDWLTAFQRLVYREPEPEPEEETEDWGEEKIGDARQEAGKKEAYVSFSGLDEDEISVEGSFQLKLLIRKLEAFDRLISAGKYSSASLVADDINNIIADFDPKIYLPKLFTRFSLQFAANINELFAFEEHKNSVEWQAMQELYKVDLESFVNFDSEAVNLGASGVTGGYGELEPDEHEDMPDEHGDMPDEEHYEDEESEEKDDW